MDFSSFFRSDLKEKEPVLIAVENLEHMMSLNESPFNPFYYFKNDFLKELKGLNFNRYMQPISERLLNSLKTYINIEKDSEISLLWGNGADEMLYYFFTALRENLNDEILTIYPSYFDYKTYSSAVGMSINRILLNKDFSLPLEKLIEAAQNKKTKALIICNPNNPTGNLFSKKDILKLIKNCNKPVLIDEAYYEFSNFSFADEIKNYPHVLVLRTFSKGFSAAGLRFGYLIGHEKMLCNIKKVITAFNLSLFIQTAAYVLLKNKNRIFKWNKFLISEKEKIFIELNQIKEVIPFRSYTNFLLFKAERHIDLYNHLLENSLSVRNVSNSNVLEKCLRVTVSSEKDNTLFIHLVKEFYSN